MDSFGGNRRFVRRTQPLRTSVSVGRPLSRTEYDQQVIERYKRQQLVKRIRRVARVAIIATKTNTSSKTRKLRQYKHNLQAQLHALHTNQYRLMAGLFLVVFAVSSFVPPLIQANDTKPITLDNQIKALVGESRDDIKNNLKYDAEKRIYNFEVPSETPTENATHTGRNADAYTTTLPQDADKGVTVTEKKTNISVTLKPDFFTANARKSEGDHVVYRSGAEQLIYTHKYNGLKEDIIIPKFKEKNLTYRFMLEVPAGVEARLDEQGNIGLYSGDTNLFGKISYGSDEDREKVEKARLNSQKTNLVMTIPFPIVKDSTGTEFTDRAEFVLGKPETVVTQQAVSQQADLPAEVQQKLTEDATVQRYELTIKAHDLADLHYPISIDPTMQVTSSADFANVNLEGNSQLDSGNNLIKRRSLSGGVINSWSNATALPRTFEQHATAAYKGYLYLIGGMQNTTRSADSWYAPLTNGVVGAWTQTATLSNPIAAHAAVAYNGYLYSSGGHDGNAGVGNVQFAKIQPNGSLGPWSYTGSHPSRYSHEIFAYNNFLYIVGGIQAANSVKYAPILASGNVNTWVDGASFNTARIHHSAALYNGVLYVSNGCASCNTGSGSMVTDLQYSKINNDGSNATWVTTTAPSEARAAPELLALDGYLYLIGGCNVIAIGSCTTVTNSVAFAQINADGSVGNWSNTNSFTTSRMSFDAVVNEGYLYFSGGCSGSFAFGFGTCGGTHESTEQYTSIKPAGEPLASMTDTGGNFANARFYHASAVYRNVIYISGGCTASGCLTPASDVQYAAINDDGSVGTWAATSSFATGRYGHGMFAYRSNVYILGGRSALTDIADGQYAKINSDGSLDAFTLDGGAQYTARHSFGLAVSGNRVYITGGLSGGSTNLNDVWYSQVKSEGDLLNWVEDTNSDFTTPRREHAAVTWGDFVYIVNGSDGTNTFNNVQYAPINSDNSLGTWTSTNAFGTASYMHKVVTIKGYMYYLGGCTGGGCGGYATGVRYKKINSDGSLDSVTNTNTTTFSAQRMSYGIAQNGDSIIMTGGCTGATSGGNSCGSIQGDTQYTNITNGGNGLISSWTTLTSMNTARGEHASTSYNGHIYSLGGCSSYSSFVCTRTTSIEYTKVSGSGSFTAPAGCGTTWCNSALSLPTATRGLSAHAVKGYLYIIGGETDSGSTANVSYVAINSDGSLGTNWQSAPSMNAARWHHAATYYNGFFYVMGGRDDTIVLGATEYTAVASDGSLSGWSSTGNNGSCCERYGHTIFVSKDRLFMLGGSFGIDVGTNRTETIYNTAVNSDGALGATWNAVVSGNGLEIYPRSPKVWVVNGMIYAGNEFSSGLFVNTLTNTDVWPQWVRTTGTTPNTDYAEQVTINGYMYNIGGCTVFTNVDPDYFKCNGNTAAVLGTAPPIQARTAHVSKLYDFNNGVKPTKLITRGTKQGGSATSVSYTSSNNTSTTLDSLQTIGDTGYNGANAQSLSLGTNRTLSRYLFLRYTIDDSQSAVFPDAGNESTITDWDVYYTANPGSRLKGGRTFTNGVDRGLDAAPQ